MAGKSSRKTGNKKAKAQKLELIRSERKKADNLQNQSANALDNWEDGPTAKELALRFEDTTIDDNARFNEYGMNHGEHVASRFESMPCWCDTCQSTYAYYQAVCGSLFFANQEYYAAYPPMDQYSQHMPYYPGETFKIPTAATEGSSLRAEAPEFVPRGLLSFPGDFDAGIMAETVHVPTPRSHERPTISKRHVTF